MCKTTGAGIAAKRALSGVTPPPLAIPNRRNTPAATGTRLSIKSELSSFQEGRDGDDMAKGQDW